MDWPGLMHAGLHLLRLSPDSFWALTPAELQIMLGASGAAVPMARPQLDALLRDFPDDVKDKDDG
ncbi:putative phage protein (TIGR02216 family) [Yoonia maricola]|uniref:Putative phage protein (TIGR02216 family) n=1 Tax=Yoonia maricola TaxID=420999 RepID=A0A2M8WMJ8_9RHOB|nr:rcc01693 family protein [Yoonia maricola]PJI92149.1 putative phage protein (TIGR02216 family) [Yoonia maricola]